MQDITATGDHCSAGLIAKPSLGDEMKVIGHFDFECWRTGINPENGRYETYLAWRDRADNVVTTQGKNAMLDKLLDLGAAYGAVAMGLHTTVGNAASTYQSPAPQVESTDYDEANRPTPSFSAAAAGVKSTSAAVTFTISATVTITGAFIALGANAATKGNTAAGNVLYSSGAFSGGSRAVVDNDVLNVSYSSTLT